MIPATGWSARYEKEREDGTTDYERVPVVAWGDEGAPLIAGSSGLISAKGSHWGEYVGLGRDYATVVAAIPGGGWRVEYEQESGEIASRPIVAWVVRSDGSMSAIGLNSYGICDDVTTFSDFHQLVAPDS